MRARFLWHVLTLSLYVLVDSLYATVVDSHADLLDLLVLRPLRLHNPCDGQDLSLHFLFFFLIDVYFSQLDFNLNISLISFGLSSLSHLILFRCKVIHY